MMQYAYNPRKLIYQQGTLKLYHYLPKRKKPHTIPLLVVFATVNRPEVLDLFPERSFVGQLLAQGMDVYLLDWGYPTLADKSISLGDYVLKYLHGTISFITRETKQKKINLIGVCQGGLISLCYATLYQNINKLVLISTPIDFQTRENIIFHLLEKINADDLIKVTGNMPGAWLTQFFISLKPFELGGKKYLNFYDHLDDEEKTSQFLRVEQWLNDSPDQAGRAFAEFIKYGYQQNQLIKGKLKLNGKRIDLKKLNIPILNVIADGDHIIPPSSSMALKKYIPRRYYTQQNFPSGHIGIFISKKVAPQVSKAIAGWLKQSPIHEDG